MTPQPLSKVGRRTQFMSLKAAMVALGIHDGEAQRLVDAWATFFALRYPLARQIPVDETNATFQALIDAHLVQVWIPPSGAYIAVAEQLYLNTPSLYGHGCLMAAKITTSRVEELPFHRQADLAGPLISRPGMTVALPGHDDTPRAGRDGRTSATPRPQAACPTCFTILPSSGVCGYCAD